MKTSFDAGCAIQSWRENLEQSPALRPGNLDELESHLRDAMADLSGRGLTEEEAFEIATRRLGGAPMLAQEFGKVNAAAVWRQRALWMLAGMLLLIAGTDLSRLASAGLSLLGSLVSSNGFALGWLGVLGMCLTAGVGTIGFCRLLAGRVNPTVAGVNWMIRHPGWFGFAVIGGLILLRLAPSLLNLMLIRSLPVQTLGQTYIVTQWFNLVGPMLLVGVVAILFTRLLLRHRRENGRAGVCAVMVVAASLLSLSPAHAAPGSDPTNNATLDQAMTLWRAGKKDEAADKFLAVDFSKRPLFPSGSVLNFTEAQFIALPQASRDKLAKQMNDDLQTIKQLAAHIKSTGDTAKAAGDNARATNCTEQLVKCGNAFDRPDSLALLKLVGTALKKMATTVPKS